MNAISTNECDFHKQMLMQRPNAECDDKLIKFTFFLFGPRPNVRGGPNRILTETVKAHFERPTVSVRFGLPNLDSLCPSLVAICKQSWDCGPRYKPCESCIIAQSGAPCVAESPGNKLSRKNNVCLSNIYNEYGWSCGHRVETPRIDSRHPIEKEFNELIV